VLHKLGRAKRQEQRCQTAHPEENLSHRSHSPYTFIGHSRHRDPTKHPTRSSLPAPSDPRPRTGQQSIPIGHALGNGLVQPIFRPPSRRPPSDCSPSVFRRDAGLKMLCIMFYKREGIICQCAVSLLPHSSMRSKKQNRPGTKTRKPFRDRSYVV
jgi:hypothetical protein